MSFMFAPGPFELLIVGLLCVAFVGIPLVLIALWLISRRKSDGHPNLYGRVPCPECGESIAAEAVKCRFCGAQLDSDEPHPDE